jgi:N-acetylneuraminic acid mutarotase
VCDSRVVVLGGESGAFFADVNELLPGGTWSALPDLTTPVSRAAGGVIARDSNTLAVLVGGRTGSFASPTILDTITLYSPTSSGGTVSGGSAPLGGVRDSRAVGVWGTRLISVGGFFSGGGSNIAEEHMLNPVADSMQWRPLFSTASTVFTDAAAAELHGKIYIIGGREFTSEVSRVRTFDPKPFTSGAWGSDDESLPFGIADAAAVSARGLIYLIGGTDGVATLTSIRTFDPLVSTPGRWSTATSMGARAVRGACAAVIGDKIYVIGGNNGGATTYAKVYEHDISIDDGAEITSSDMVVPVSFARCATDGKRIYVFGGVTSGGTFVNQIQIYDPVTNSWTANGGDVFTNTRTGAIAAYAKGRLFVIGGENSVGTVLSDGYAIDPTDIAGVGTPHELLWKVSESPRTFAAHCVFADRIFVFGGRQEGGDSNGALVFTP